MMHPSTTIVRVSEEVGVGVFAREAIPQGTIVWARDPLDRILTHAEVKALPQPVHDYSLTYMYRNHHGEFMLLWDHGKYVNHSFHPNCMPTPYGFDIAIRDIAVDEEITEDYGLLNIIEDFEPLAEGGAKDRKVVRGDDIKRHAMTWDLHLQDSMRCAHGVAQPLWNLLPPAITHELQEFWNEQTQLKSVSTMLLR